MNFQDNPGKKNNTYISVTQLNTYVKMLMESDGFLGSVAVRGEISNFKRHYSGHLYFTLKDSESALRCVMFSSSAARLNFSPKDGSDVVAYGRVSVFPRDGSYQLYISSMLDSGLGDRYAAFEKLKAKLSAEGLFDPSRKKAIPQFPHKVGIVTSPTGAAIHDLMNILGRRYPLCELYLYPALVQGAGAAASVTSGIEYFNTKCPVDVIISGRGGGSFEDLDAFNDEKLARCVAASRIPVISAVGHETDFTIQDFVADLRAPTPSAAAELAVPDMAELMNIINTDFTRLNSAVGKKLSLYESSLTRLAASPVLQSPGRVLDAYDERILNLGKRLDLSYAGKTERAEKKLASLCAGLDALSPLRVLGRGYSMTLLGNEVLSSAGKLKKGDNIELRFRDGKAEAEITGVFRDE